MSLDAMRIHCTGCDYEYSVLYQPIELKCAFGTGTVSYYRTTAWCHECGRIRDAEKLPGVASLKRKLVCLTGKGCRAWLRCLLPSHRSETRDKQNMIQWRQSRTSPPRCLHCGTTNISILDFRQIAGSMAEAQGFSHACGGRLVHDHRDKTGMRFNFSTETIWLDPEGNKVQGREIPGKR